MTRIRAALAAALLLAALVGCTPAAADQPVVAVAFPGTEDDPWGRGAAELRSALEDGGYRVEVRFAGEDIPTQLRQLDELIAARPLALVVAPIDGTSVVNRLDRADALGVPVVAYDRMVPESRAVDYFVTFDHELAGRQQAWSLLEGLGLAGPEGAPLEPPATEEQPAEEQPAGPPAVELLAGSGDSVAAQLMFAGALEVLQPYLDDGSIAVPSGRVQFEQAATLRWDPETAAARIVETLATGATLDGVLSPDDAMSRAVLDVLPEPELLGSEPLDPSAVVTGCGAQLSSVRSIAAGHQHSTVLEDPRRLARAVADLIRRILRAEPTSAAPTDGPAAEPSVAPEDVAPTPVTTMLEPVMVDASNLEFAVLESGYLTREQLAG